MRAAILALLLGSLGGLKGKGVKDFRAAAWLPLFTEEEAGPAASAAQKRKDTERLRLALRALSKGRVKRKAGR